MSGILGIPILGVPAPVATVDCVVQQVCVPGVTGGNCDFGPFCATAGEQHRIKWDHTGCVDANHHIALHQSKNGGSFLEVDDLLGCNNADNDPKCCTVTGCVPDGQFVHDEGLFDNSVALSNDFTYRVRIENDPDDTLVDSLDATGCVDCGGTHACL